LYKSAIGYQANFLKAEFCSISERNHTNMITTVDRYQTRLFYAGFLISYGIQNPAWNFFGLVDEIYYESGIGATFDEGTIYTIFVRRKLFIFVTVQSTI